MQDIEIENIIDLETNCKIKDGYLVTTIKLQARIGSDKLSKLLQSWPKRERVKMLRQLLDSIPEDEKAHLQYR